MSAGSAGLLKEFTSLPNLYEYMGVKQEADEKTIRKAFKSLTLKYHPDLNPEAGAVLKRANEILENTETRKQYDEFLQQAKEVKLSKEAISEKRKHFADLLRKREEEVKEAANHPDSTFHDDLVEEYLRKKRMTKNVERIYEGVGQTEINSVLEDRAKQKDELKKLLATIKVKWDGDSSKKFNRTLIRMIFNRFGSIQDINLVEEKCKCYVQYVNLQSAEAAMKYFEDQKDFRIQFLVNENRQQCLQKVADRNTGLELNSEVLNRIAHAYNGSDSEKISSSVNHLSRKELLAREVERLKAMKKMFTESTSTTNTSKP